MQTHQLSYASSILSLGTVDELVGQIPSDAFILTDENVSRLWGRRFARWNQLVLPAGEQTKSFEFFESTVLTLAESGLKRSTSIVALGGGVIGDLAGFVAATYMRGVPLIQFPTTLLAQVDSSVGGKVGIDLPQGKNLVGAFYHPSLILIATETLKTLDERQLKNGLAEVWKYAFIMAPDLIDAIQSAIKEQEYDDVVLRCIRLKEEVVREDEFDRSGRRAILNYGHTVGHALEAMQGYAGLLHGEAISVGMVVEASLGERLGITEPGTSHQVRQWLQETGLPTASPDLQRTHELIELMKKDKKAAHSGLGFSLLEGVGRCKLVEGIPESEVREALLTA